MDVPVIVKAVMGEVTVHAQYRAKNGTVIGLYETQPGPFPTADLAWLVISPVKGSPYWHEYKTSLRKTALADAKMIASAMDAERE